MSNATFRKVFIIGLLALALVVVYQAYVFTHYSEIRQQQTEDNITGALNAVVEQLREINPESGKILYPVRKISEGYYRVQINDTLHPYLLENLLREKFAQFNLEMSFEYAIYDCFTDSTVFASRVSPSTDQKQSSRYLKDLKWRSDGHYFGVYFPQLPNAWLNLPQIFQLSVFILLALLVFFGYTLYVVSREKRLQHIKSDFINNITHQLKTPVSAMVLSINAMQRGELKKSYLDILKRETDHLKELIAKVLWASKAEQGKLQVDLRKGNIGQWIQTWADKKSVEIQVKLSKKTEAYFDSELLVMVLDNLLTNTIEHNEMLPEIEISSRPDKKKWVEINYIDKGKGIPKAEFKRVFKKFYSGKNQLNSPKQGFGLGLYLSKQAMQKMRGEIFLLESYQGVHLVLRFKK
ncbi:MAG: sensor histidine kinase [Luteibaculum sp.]